MAFRGDSLNLTVNEFPSLWFKAGAHGRQLPKLKMEMTFVSLRGEHLLMLFPSRKRPFRVSLKGKQLSLKGDAQGGGGRHPLEGKLLSL